MSVMIDAFTNLPYFDRLNFFYGQMLGPLELRTAQALPLEKLKLHNRCLHGYGVVCGLEVVPEPSLPPCPPAVTGNPQPAPSTSATTPASSDCLPDFRTRVIVKAGLAIDCEGNELIVRHGLTVDLAALSAEDRARIDPASNPNGQSVWISVCFCETPIDPSRPVIPDPCASPSGCFYGKVRESVCARVTLDPPAADGRCTTCCDGCADTCIVIARIDGFKPGQQVTADAVHNEVRRLLETAAYAHATITGVSWTHAGQYTAGEIFGSSNQAIGLEIDFSRPVQAASITAGVLDVWIVRDADIIQVPIEYVNLPAIGTITSLTFQPQATPAFEVGDRVMVTLRSEFVLDECCRPIDGANVGGRVPLLPAFANNDRPRPAVCASAPPPRFGPWTTGNGTGGSRFESWFFIGQ